jgi:hypothetical protein
VVTGSREAANTARNIQRNVARPFTDEDAKGSPAQQVQRAEIRQRLQALKEQSQAPGFIPEESAEAQVLRASQRQLDKDIRKAFDEAYRVDPVAPVPPVNLNQ